MNRFQVELGDECEECIFTPRREGNKEMFASGVINDIKERYIPAYFRYLLGMLCQVMNNKEGMNR